MITASRNMRDAWTALPDGAPLEITHEMMRVTFDIILETMLSGRGNTDVARVEISIRDFLESTSWQTALSALGAPKWTPFPGKRRSERGGGYLRQTVSDSIAERRRTGERRDDLLSLMLDAKDPETGDGLSDIDIRDNIITFIGAGHETTALALTWTFFLLARHPDIERRVLAEIAQVTGGAPIEANQVADLTYTRQVIQEAMRVYPPVAMIVRQSTRDLSIGGVPITPHDNVFVPIYAIHHHHRLWPNPEAFDPDRFTPDAVKSRPPLVLPSVRRGPAHLHRHGLRHARIRCYSGHVAAFGAAVGRSWLYADAQAARDDAAGGGDADAGFPAGRVR